MKRILSIFLLVLSVLSTPCIGLAESKGTMTPFYVAIREVEATLSLSGSTASCMGKVKAYDASTTSTVVVKLMKKNGTAWNEVTRWNGSGSGTSGATAKGTYSLKSGTYKVITTGTVKDKNGKVLDSASVESQQRTY